MTLLGSASPLAQSRRGQGWSMLLALALASVTLATPSCQGAARPRSGTKVAHQPAHASRARHAAHARTPGASAARGASPIAPETRAPQPAGAPDPALDSLLRHCGPGDQALHLAAQRLLEPDLEQQPLDTTSITFAVRTAGGPYVYPRALRVSQPEFDLAELEQRLESWLDGAPAPETRRCGVAAATSSARGFSLAMVSAQAPAHLEPLPTHIEPGEKVELSAVLFAPATHAELVVLGPHGRPRELSVGLSGSRVTANFYLDTAGTHRLQLMVDGDGGPVAALEAWVGVDESLPTRPDAERAPGEAAAHRHLPPDSTVLAMMDAARRSEGAPPLNRHRELDRLAEAHAVRMQLSGKLAHDLGEGHPLWRIQAAQLRPKDVGENLARAPSLVRAHRAIWLSPSHRANLLAPHFDSVGIGAVRDQQGEWWVCQLLADLQ